MSKYEIRPQFECQNRILNAEKRKTTNFTMLKIIEVFMRSVGTVNVLKVLTLIYNYYFRCS